MSSRSLRALDIVLALVLLAPVSVLVAGLALAIWSVDGYPPFFLQRRLGRGGRMFTIFKLQTLRPGEVPTDHTYPERVEQCATRLGGWLRDHWLDELPQVLNVLAGHMSFVGPRAVMRQTIERVYLRNPDRIDEVTAWEQRRALVRPAIWGPFQVRGSRALECDLEWVAHQSWSRYLAVLGIALVIMLTGKRRYFRWRMVWQARRSLIHGRQEG